LCHQDPRDRLSAMADGVRRKTCRRYDVAGHAHYLTFSCFQRRPLLADDQARRCLLAALESARLKHPFDLWAYVIMSEHVHAVILPHPGSRISEILQAIKQPVAQTAARRERQRHRAHPTGGAEHSRRFWLPGGGYDRNVWSDVEAHEKIGYVHANPVRRGLVAFAEDWPWSSARAWSEGVDEPIRVDLDSVPPAPLR